MDYQRKKDETRNALTQAFWTLYQKKPLQKITVRDITELANCSRGTFYLHFRDVYDLLDQFEEKLASELFRDTCMPFFDALISGNLGILSDEKRADEYTAKIYERTIPYVNYLLSDRGDPAFLEKLRSTIIKTYSPQLRTHGDDTKFGEYILHYFTGALLAGLRFRSQEGLDLPLGLANQYLYQCTTQNIAELISNTSDASVTTK